MSYVFVVTKTSKLLMTKFELRDCLINLGAKNPVSRTNSLDLLILGSFVALFLAMAERIVDFQAILQEELAERAAKKAEAKAAKEAAKIAKAAAKPPPKSISERSRTYRKNLRKNPVKSIETKINRQIRDKTKSVMMKNPQETPDREQITVDILLKTVQKQKQEEEEERSLLIESKNESQRVYYELVEAKKRSDGHLEGMVEAKKRSDGHLESMIEVAKSVDRRHEAIAEHTKSCTKAREHTTSMLMSMTSKKNPNDSKSVATHPSLRKTLFDTPKRVGLADEAKDESPVHQLVGSLFGGRKIVDTPVEAAGAANTPQIKYGKFDYSYCLLLFVVSLYLTCVALQAILVRSDFPPTDGNSGKWFLIESDTEILDAVQVQDCTCVLQQGSVIPVAFFKKIGRIPLIRSEGLEMCVPTPKELPIQERIVAIQAWDDTILCIGTTNLYLFTYELNTGNFTLGKKLDMKYDPNSVALVSGPTVCCFGPELYTEQAPLQLWCNDKIHVKSSYVLPKPCHTATIAPGGFSAYMLAFRKGSTAGHLYEIKPNCNHASKLRPIPKLSQVACCAIAANDIGVLALLESGEIKFNPLDANGECSKELIPYVGELQFDKIAHGGSNYFIGSTEAGAVYAIQLNCNNGNGETELLCNLMPFEVEGKDCPYHVTTIKHISGSSHFAAVVADIRIGAVTTEHED